MVCLTDGFDNISPSLIGDVMGLVSAIKGITGPKSGRTVYDVRNPLSKRENNAADEEEASDPPPKRMPIWITWVALGVGGNGFIENVLNYPSEVTFVDLTGYCESLGAGGPGDLSELLRFGNSRKQKSDTKPWEVPVPDLDPAPAMGPGHLVEVEQPADELDDEIGHVTKKEAIVLEAPEKGEDPEKDEDPQFLVVYTEEHGGGQERVSKKLCKRVVHDAPARKVST